MSDDKRQITDPLFSSSEPLQQDESIKKKHKKTTSEQIDKDTSKQTDRITVYLDSDLSLALDLLVMKLKRNPTFARKGLNRSIVCVHAIEMMLKEHEMNGDDSSLMDWLTKRLVD